MASYGQLTQLQVGGLLATTAWVIFNIEGYFVAFINLGNASALKCGDVHEHVFAAIFWSDETKAFAVVEEFYCAFSRHLGILSRW